MRKLLMLSLLVLLTAGATGCISSNPCGGWHPGALLGINRRSADCCCEPVMSAPVMQQGACCQ